MAHRNKLNLNIENLKQDKIELRLYLSSRTLSWHVLEKLGLISSITHTHSEGGRWWDRMTLIITKLRRRDRQVPRSYWPANLLKLVGFRFNERPCLLIIRWAEQLQLTPDAYIWPTHAYTYTYTHEHIYYSCWKLKLDLLQKQSVLWTTETSL